MDEVNLERSEKKMPQLQCKFQKSNDEADTETQADRYIAKNGSIALSELQGLSELPVCVKLQRVSANWISGQLPPTLCNVNLIIKPGQLCAVVGAVGSGKSSLLQLLLKELNPGAGSVILTQDSKDDFQGNISNGYFTSNPNLRMSYASQEPWLFGGTVRENILFGQPYDKARYTQVIQGCRYYSIHVLLLYYCTPLCQFLRNFAQFANSSVLHFNLIHDSLSIQRDISRRNIINRYCRIVNHYMIPFKEKYLIFLNFELSNIF